MNHFQRTLFTTVIVVSPFLHVQAPAQDAPVALVQAGSEAALRVGALLQRLGERVYAGAPDGSDEGRRTWVAQLSGSAVDSLRAAMAPSTCQ